ncbi:cytochrome c-type biogenesis protein CcmH [Wolbachia endosymbiont of Cruorifilaria tuberocauda]|uniref:cytochrome c-type biogenesis protein n=1 Tax=Wolbachia endosymbiont of Cruorifilaria tuberocauda TaxID=1812111 RepID=UPI0015889BFF|nr:cytochrome c-type biogenesis protein [Wolbachia endosymbiont of Cruorifilaria tuberocauda]QKX01391.1 cytochrome c-type biogenesis protein CcmH [Wolbachia endosymbiont of Cruorifilaria tuberocauda]
MRTIVNLLFTLIFWFNTSAFTLDDELSDKSMEKRATNLFEIIKCPICSGELLSESESQVALNIRKAIRKKIVNQYTDEQIISELKNFYGNSIITIPPVKASTYILWFAPFIIIVIGYFLIQKCINNKL